MNNSYDNHEIDYVSPSTLNLFIAEPAMAMMKLAGHRGKVGVGAFRGTAIDAIVPDILRQEYSSVEALKEAAVEIFDEECRNNGVPIDDEKSQKERLAVPRYVEQAEKFYGSFGGVDGIQHAEFQTLIEYQDEALPVIFKGYTDIVYDDVIRDVKTSSYKVNEPKMPHIIQMAVYGKALGIDKLYLDYICKNDVYSFKLTDEQIELGYNTAVRTTQAIGRALSISDDIRDCAKLYVPDFSSFYWKDEEMVEKAKRIWDI